MVGDCHARRVFVGIAPNAPAAQDDSIRSGRSIGFPAVVTIAAFFYMVLLGATAGSELSPTLAAISGLVTLPFIAAYVYFLPSQADQIDRLVLVSVLLFVGACVVSSMPRQSFEPALAALAYASALFVARRATARPRVRQVLVWTLVALSLVMTIVTAARWETYLADWMDLSGWRVPPALNMELPSNPWGHRHDVTLLVAMLYPAWWLGRPSTLRRVAGAVIGLVVLAIVIADGSRTLWIAFLIGGAATAVVMLRDRGRLRASRQAWIGVTALVVVLVASLVVSGAASSLIDRLTNYDSVGWRTAMWSALLNSWAAHPAAGSGPGTFPWLLQTTGYFDGSSFAPRHPDSAPIELLAEGGLLGVAALAVLLWAVAAPLWRSRNAGAVFALTSYAVASVANNPTDFAFANVVAVVWVAYALPRAFDASRSSIGISLRSRAIRMGSLAALGVIALAWGGTNLASFAYDGAAGAVARGDMATGLAELERAEALDPSMALYARQSGTAGLVAGRDGALERLERAVALNPHDDLAWRTLAIAFDQAGNQSAAAQARGRALELQRSDPTNLLLSAKDAARQGEEAAAEQLLAELVQAWPETVFSSTWQAYADDVGVETDSVIAMAADRWGQGKPAPELTEDQGLWLAVLANREDLRARAEGETGYPPAVTSAMVKLLACQPATEILDEIPPADLRSVAYWWLRMRDASLTGADASTARAMIELMVRRKVEANSPGLNELGENSVRATSTDIWGYRRYPMPWPVFGDLLPSPYEGMIRWLSAEDCQSPSAPG